MKNKIILLFSIIFIIGINCYLLNVPLVNGDVGWYILPGGGIPCGGPIQNCGIKPGSWIGPSFQPVTYGPVNLPVRRPTTTTTTNIISLPTPVSTPTISAPKPTLNFYYTNPSQVSPNTLSVTLNWASTNTTSCIASTDPVNNQWSGSIALSGSKTIISDTTTSPTVFLTCSGAGGSITKIMSYVITSVSTSSPAPITPDEPTLTFYYTSPTKVSSGDSATLIWESTDATSCTASASPANSQWSGLKDAFGSQTISNIEADTTFALFCSGAGGNIANATSVELSFANTIPVAPTSPPTLTLYASPVRISSSGSTTMIWASTNTTSCTASASPANSQWSGTKNISGTQIINNITANTTFALVCSGAEGNINDATLVALSSASSSALGSTTGNQNQTSQLQIQINQILAQIAQLQSQLTVANTQQQTPIQSTQQQTDSNSNFCYTFTKTLKYKDSGYEVGALQAMLRKEGLLNITKLTTYFGQATQRALIVFQEKYRDEILTPLELTQGTGNVGNATIKKLNQLYGCK